MCKVVVTFGNLAAFLLVLAKAAPQWERQAPLGFGMGCAGDPVCLDKALVCGERMENANRPPPSPLMRGGLRDMEHSNTLRQCAQDLGIMLPESISGVPQDSFGSLNEDQMMQLKQCQMMAVGVFDSDGLLNREPLKESIKTAFAGDHNLLLAMVDAVDNCPEPQDMMMVEYFQCLDTVCIDWITI